MFCEPPPLSAIDRQAVATSKDGDVSIPLLLVRNDGVIYNPELVYHYPKSAAKALLPSISHRGVKVE